VIVNDFGSLAIDVGLLGDVADGGMISLPNGCVCCTIGAGLHEALGAFASSPSPPDHVVIEVSGVADPAVAAAWGTVPPFEQAGVIVLADATSIVERSRDRYVGDEVRRQIVGADLVVVTKSDVCDEDRLAQVEQWLAATSRGAPTILVVEGRIPTDVILGVRPIAPIPAVSESARHDDRYDTWSWTSTEPVSRAVVDRFVDVLPAAVLRVKGRVLLDDGTWALVQVVGRRADITTCAPGDRSELVAIAVRTHSPDPFVLHFG
jgi:G3E family GTPase